MATVLNASLPKYGLEVVYLGHLPVTVTDFTSYFSAIEESGAEILVPGLVGGQGLPFIREWYERQSPVIVCGLLSMAQEKSFWNLTQGQCETVSFSGYPAIAGYPLTDKTLPTREAYVERWGEVITGSAVAAYDIVRFILPDAIKRAGTTETEAVIKALEKTDIETSTARRFTFTTAHDIMIPVRGADGIDEDYIQWFLFQWQNGNQVIVYPDRMREEAGATYKYPPWRGPWDNIQTP
jgi:ABC-type branched-subunit amino acid transport system substrate-binding protein